MSELQQINIEHDIEPTVGSMGALALHYQSFGLRVFPLVPGSKHGYQTKSRGHQLRMIAAKTRVLTREEIISFWNAHPEANIGLFPGEESGISVIDVDTNQKHGDKHWVNGLTTLETNGLSFLMERGLVVKTPSGGYHLYFKYTSALPAYKRCQPLGIQTFNSGKGYIVMPPSTLWEDGGFSSYQFENIYPAQFDVALLEGCPSTRFFVELPGEAELSRKMLATGFVQSPYKNVPSPYIQLGQTFQSRKTYTDKQVKRNRRRQKQKNRLKGKIANTGIYQFVSRQKDMQRILEREGKQLVSDSSNQAVIAEVQGAFARLNKKNYLQLDDGRCLVKHSGIFYPIQFQKPYLVTEQELASLKPKARTLVREDGSLIGKWKTSHNRYIWYFLNIKAPYHIDNLL